MEHWFFFMLFTGILLHYERAFHQSSLRKHMEGNSFWQISNHLECGTLIAYLHWSVISRSQLWVTFRICRWMPSSQDDSSTFSLSICFQRSHISSILWSYHPFKYETGNDLEIDWGKISSFLAFASYLGYPLSFLWSGSLRNSPPDSFPLLHLYNYIRVYRLSCMLFLSFFGHL